MTGPAEDIEYADPLLARERTELAWTRTAIAFAALGAILLRSRPAAGAPIIVISVLIWRLGHRSRYPGDSSAAARRMLLTTLAVIAVALAALVITLLGHRSAGLHL